jgi:hypothetical protein
VIYSNDTQNDIDTDSTVTTSYLLSNSSQAVSFVRQPLLQFSSDQLAALNNLQILNSSQNFFDAFYWAVNLDLGQFNPQNILTDPTLLLDATDVFHDNAFINDTFQQTPLSDGAIPGDAYRFLQNESDPLVQTPANILATYQCWKWVGKPSFAAFLDIIVPTLVLFILLCLGIQRTMSTITSSRRKSSCTIPR